MTRYHQCLFIGTALLEDVASEAAEQATWHAFCENSFLLVQEVHRCLVVQILYIRVAGWMVISEF